MVFQKTTSRAVLFALLSIFFTASSHSIVEATIRGNDQSLRRLPERRVRGLRREKGPIAEGVVDITNGAKKGGDQMPRHRPQLPNVFRPIPQKFNKLGLNPNLKTAKVSDKLEFKLPESKQESKKEAQQVLNIKVNKKSGLNLKAGGLSSALKGNDNTGFGKKIGKKIERGGESGIEHFNEVEVELYRRVLPSFSIKFNFENSSGNLPNLADYNELSFVSEEYLDKFFRSVFEDVQVRHDDTVLFLEVSEDDPHTVNFQLTLEFIIPGEVPTINFLIDRLQDGLERDTSREFYIDDLKSMSETNPFSKTISFEVVSRPPVSAAELGRTGGNQGVNSVEHVGRNNVLISLLASMGCVVLVGSGFMWKKK